MTYFGTVIILMYMLLTVAKISERAGSCLLIRSAVIKLIGVITVIMHGYLLYKLIDTEYGQNLALGNMLSMVAWLISCVAIVAALRDSIINLQLFIFPLAGISIIYAILTPEHVVIPTRQFPAELVHILLVVVTLGLLGLTGLQASLINAQNFFLKKPAWHKLLKGVPALELAEKTLLRMLWLSFILLTLVCLGAHICTRNAAIYTTTAEEMKLNDYNIISQAGATQLVDPAVGLQHKRREIYMTIKLWFVCFAWLSLAVVLLGRNYFGWHGIIAARMALLSFGLLAVAFLLGSIGLTY